MKTTNGDARHPTPGIYYDVDFGDYLKWPLVSKSGLTSMTVSPAQYLHDRGKSWRPTDDMLLGSAVDCRVFDGIEEFRRQYIELPTGMRRDGRHKKYQEFLEAAQGREPLPGRIWGQVEEIAISIFSHPAACELITSGRPQVSVVWDDLLTGVRCKGRPDLIVTDLRPRHEQTEAELLSGPLVVDLKLTNDNAVGPFQKTLAKYRYHWQAAMYLDGLMACPEWAFGEVPFVFIAVKSSPVYSVELYVLDEESIEIGRREYRSALATYARCKATNNWPASTGLIQQIGLPRWAR